MTSVRKAHPTPSAQTAAPAALLVAGASTLIDHLHNAGYSISKASTARQTLKQIYERQPDLLILDSKLCQGKECGICCQIKDNDQLGFLPIIVIQDTPEQGCQDCQGDAVLIPPIDYNELDSWIRFLLRTKHRIDRLIRENQELTAASRRIEVMKSDIISNVSHELSTPLVQVKAAVALLAEDTAHHSGSGQSSSMADMAAQAVARLESAVDNIRQLAQTHNIHLSPVSIPESVDLALRMIERSWASRGTSSRVEKYLDNGLPIVVADKRPLARLIQLLLDNALKFSPEESPVHLRVASNREGEVRISVQDFGIGIAEEDQTRIFEAFYQVDGSSTRRYGGTGTGLALAMLLAHGMHTEIQVQSVPGQGSTFSFRLPVADLAQIID